LSDFHEILYEDTKSESIDGQMGKISEFKKFKRAENFMWTFILVKYHTGFDKILYTEGKSCVQNFLIPDGRHTVCHIGKHHF